MKRNRLAEITIILAIILVTLISFVGIYVQNQTNMENKINEFSFGEELNGYMELVFSTEGEITEENVQKSKEIMEERLKDIELSEYNMYANKENGNILLQVSNNQDIEYIVNCLYLQGKFELVDSETKEVLLDNSLVKNSYALYDTVTSGTAIYVAIEFNEDGTNKLKEVSSKYILTESTDTEEDSEEEESPTVSLNLDGTTLITTGFAEPLNDGVMYITIGGATTNSTTLLTYVKEATKIATAINNGVMPIQYTITNDTYISSNIMESDLMNVVYGVGIVVMISLVILVIKYRKMGLLTSLAYWGYIAIYLLIIRYTDSTITFNSICGIILILVLNYIFTFKIAKNIESDDSIAEVKEKFKKYIIEFIMLLVPITLLTVVIAFTNLSSLGIVLFWGIITMIAYNFIVTKILLEVRTKK